VKLNISAFALAFGIWWGVGLFIATWWLIIAGMEPRAPLFIEHFYFGYGVTPLGSLLGLLWGFVCGTLAGGILAGLYNILSERFTSHTSAKTA
jgi:hypothetical protein